MLKDGIIKKSKNPWISSIILVCLDTFEEHLAHLRKVFIKLREANLVIKLKKCKFGQKKIKFLGHIIGTDELRTDSENIKR